MHLCYLSYNILHCGWCKLKITLVQAELSPSVSVVGSCTVQNKTILFHQVYKVKHNMLCCVVHFAHQ